MGVAGSTKDEEPEGGEEENDKAVAGPGAVAAAAKLS